MKSLLTIVILILLTITAGYYLFKNKVGDIRPALLPAQSQETKQIVNDTPFSAAGWNIAYFARNLGGVRDLEFSPEGTLLASIPSEGKVIALVKTNGSVQVKEVLTNLDSPHGLAFYPSANGANSVYNGKLFIAEERQVARYSWDQKSLSASREKVLFDLPPRGNHFTRSLVFDKEGRLYVSIGSTCNVCNEKNERYAAVLISDADGTSPRLFAKGLRNAVFMTQNPKTGEIWVTEMGRDYLGDNLPPDEVNILKENKDYGWPNCYGNKIADKNFNPSAECANTEPPVFEIPAHSAPLGLTFDPDGNLLVAYHGSWNRSVPDGYKVMRMRINGNTVTSAEDFITGFINETEAIGRPVDLIFDKEGDLYLSDDKAGAVYILSKTILP